MGHPRRVYMVPKFLKLIRVAISKVKMGTWWWFLSWNLSTHFLNSSSCFAFRRPSHLGHVMKTILEICHAVLHRLTGGPSILSTFDSHTVNPSQGLSCEGIFRFKESYGHSLGSCINAMWFAEAQFCLADTAFWHRTPHFAQHMSSSMVGFHTLLVALPAHPIYFSQS